MRRYFLHSVQGRIVALLMILMGLMLLASIYTTRYLSQTVMLQAKEDKLLGIAHYLERRLGERDYDDILSDAGALQASREEKIAVLHQALEGVTDEIATIYPGLGVGYYALELDAIVTYGPSETYDENVGVSIKPDHPGRTVMAENTPIVRMGSMVRGDIMNAMYPIERNGVVIGYTWANELTTEIEREYGSIASRIIIFLVAFFILTICIAVYLSRRLMRNVDKLVAGIKDMRFDLTKRVCGISGELGEVAESINSMADHIEKTSKEHEALLLAEAANLAQRDFLARMSHELRTPMNGVLGMTRLAMQADNKEQGMTYLKKIQSSAALLLGIINDILDFSKIEAGKLELEKRPFAMREVVDNIRELMLPRVNEKNIDIRIEVDGSVPEAVIGDSLKFSQILLNLLGNAVKFTKAGHVSLSMKAETEKDGRVKLTCAVSDTGIGMSQEQIHLLFKPFSQGDSSTVREFGGTGLGLSISKALVELMGGSIDVESRAGEGSTFTFRVLFDPYQGDLALLDAADQDASVEQDYRGFQVLLAEDNEINREIALAVFTEFGMEIHCAQNGEEALEAFEAGTYDLILMDIRMPIMDGIEATKRIRALEAQAGERRTPIVAMTANAMQEDKAASMEAGMNGHISKPLDMTEIKRELRKVFGSR